jgi:hypothetical protein
VPAPGGYDDGEIDGMTGRGNWNTWRKPAPMPLCPPQTPYPARMWTQAAVVGSQQLTAWAMAQPQFCVYSLLGQTSSIIHFFFWLCVGIILSGRLGNFWCFSYMETALVKIIISLIMQIFLRRNSWLPLLPWIQSQHVLQAIGSYLPDYMVSHPRRLMLISLNLFSVYYFIKQIFIVNTSVLWKLYGFNNIMSHVLVTAVYYFHKIWHTRKNCDGKFWINL